MTYQSVNPYRIGAGFILRRLSWDARIAAWRSRSRFRRLKNSRAGSKGIIFCNGPSLLKVDFDLVRRSGVLGIGLNKINLLFERTPWRPDYICACNGLVLEQNAGFYNHTDIPLFLDVAGRRWVRDRRDVTFMHSVQVNRFAEDCTWSYVQGSTVTYMAMQIAFHLGCTRVALVGCDHNFDAKGPAHAKVASGEVDRSHFDPNYFAGGVHWNLPDLVGSEYFYALAGRHYAKAGREILNCTEGGKLELFRRQSLGEFLASS
jgi:hypothetical protein